MAEEGMIDLARPPQPPAFPLYDMPAPNPYCCEFTFGEEELERLKLDASCEEGDHIILKIKAVVVAAHSEAGCSYVRLSIQEAGIVAQEQGDGGTG